MRAALAAFALGVSLGLVGCGDSPSEPAASGPPPASGQPQPAVPQKFDEKAPPPC